MATYRGTVAGDPRLTGETKVDGRHLVNLATGLGTAEGTFEVRDPATNRLQAHGKWYGVYTEGLNFHGLLLGRVTGEGAGPGEEALDHGELFAHFKSVVNPVTGAVAGELGGTSGDPRTPAVIQSGHCTGPFTHVL